MGQFKEMDIEIQELAESKGRCEVQHVSTKNKFYIDGFDGEFAKLTSTDGSTSGETHRCTFMFYNIVNCTKKCAKKCPFHKDTEK